MTVRNSSITYPRPAIEVRPARGLEYVGAMLALMAGLLSALLASLGLLEGYLLYVGWGFPFLIIAGELLFNTPVISPRSAVLVGFVGWFLIGFTDPRMWADIPRNVQATGVAVLNLSLGAFLLGCGGKGRKASLEQNWPWLTNRQSRFVFFLLILGYALVGVVGRIYVYSRLGLSMSDADYALRAQTIGFQVGSYAPLFYISSRFMLGAMLLAAIPFGMEGRTSRFLKIVGVLLFSANVLVAIPGSGGRAGTVVPIVVTFLYVYLAKPRMKHVALKAGLVAALVLLIYLVMTGFRRLGYDVDRPTEYVTKTSPTGDFSLVTSDFFRSLDLFSSPADRYYGSTFLSFFVFWVPRSVWPEKPYGFGYRLALLKGEPERVSAAAATFPGELYANFGMAGVLVGMFLFGLACRALYRWYLSGKRFRSGYLTVAYVFTSYYLFMFLRGDFFSMAGDIVGGLILFLAAGFFLDHLSSSPSHQRMKFVSNR